MRDITDEPKGFEWSAWVGYGEPQSESSAARGISKLSERNQKLLLFLFVHGNKGHTYSDRWNSQKEVKALAAEYGINYRMLDAQARLEVAMEKAKKHVEKFKLYVTAVENGDDSGFVPRVWSENWKPK